jgi:hypothetical protein
MDGPRRDKSILVHDRDVCSVDISDVSVDALALAPFPPRNETIARM